ncbi:MAG: hypothetical protein R2706_07980 [Acidimicrobiales bacterium]
MRRDRKRRRRALMLGTITGLTLLALTAGIFGIIFKSRDVATESSRLNTFSEVVRATTVGRAQLGFAVALDGVDSDLEADAATTAALDDADASFEGLASSIELFKSDINGLDDRAGEQSFEQYIVAGQVLADNIRSGDRTTPQLIANFDTAYDDARTVAINRRAVALDKLQAADLSLSRLGGLVSFMVAFVVPSVAIAIYRSVSRSPRDLLEAEARLVRDDVRSSLRHDLVLSQLSELRRQIAEAPSSGRPTISASKRLAEIERTFRSLEKAQVCDFQAVNIGDQITEAASTANATGHDLRVTVNVRDQVIGWSDPDVLELLLSSIIKDCSNRSATMVSIGASSEGDDVVIRIVHDGVLRSPVELSLVSEQRTIGDRLSLLRGSDLGLLTALHLADDIAGSLIVCEEAARQVMVVRLPLAAPAQAGAT